MNAPSQVPPPDPSEAVAFGLVLGQVVANLRKQAGLSQADLAGRVGLSQSSLSKIEAGKRPDAFTYGRLAQAFGLEVQDLDRHVHAAMDKTRDVVAAVHNGKGKSGKKGGASWGEILALVGLVGIVIFVVAALLEGGAKGGASGSR